MTKILKERWMKLAGVLSEQAKKDLDDEEEIKVVEDENWDDSDDDFIPGASAYGHSGD